MNNRKGVIMRKIIIVFTLIFSLIDISYCQKYIDVLTLPQPDSSLKYWNSFYENADKIMVLSDKYANDNEYKRIYGYFLGDTTLIVKMESELSEDDYNRPLLIHGPIDGFKNWGKFNVPIKTVKNGFKFFDNYYTEPNDGIYYTSRSRMVFTGNSINPVWLVQAQFHYFPYTIVRNNERAILGNDLPSETFEIDLISIRNNNYTTITTQDFILYVSKNIDPALVSENVAVIDSFPQKVYEQLNIKPVTDPIAAYIHSEPNEATFFANFYWMQGYDELPNDRTFGTVFMKQLHCVGFYTGLIKHEAFHAIWEKSVGSTTNAFFIEGIQGYYEWGQDTSKINSDYKMLNSHIDYLKSPDFKELVLEGSTYSFWGKAPSPDGWTIAYPLSGLFVKHLIDNWGIERFKEMYVIEDKLLAFKELYNKTVDELITDFINRIDN
ncbi:MAG TPA: hypothetical protein PK397_01530 [Ignavibacteriaceae bacterium]|nr:hypothetical protein [Ignavibacteriaceae bacterium]